MKLAWKYFLLVVVGVGSIGIWWPIVLEFLSTEKVDSHDIPPNLTTYFVAILFSGCIDFFLNLLRKDNKDKLSTEFIDIVWIIVAVFIAVTIETFLQLRKHECWAYCVAIFGIGASWRMWWVVNKENPNLQEIPKASNASPDGYDLGGNNDEYNL